MFMQVQIKACVTARRGGDEKGKRKEGMDCPQNSVNDKVQLVKEGTRKKQVRSVYAERVNCKVIDQLRMVEWNGIGVDEVGIDYDGGGVLEQLRI
jgi:hypothetical protein